MDNFPMLFKEYGFVGLVTGSVIALLFLVIKWTLQTTKEILAQGAEERKAANIMLMQWKDELARHSEQAKEFHQTVSEAHRFQREEHERLASNQQTICGSLKQVEEALGRINGYKHQ